MVVVFHLKMLLHLKNPTKIYYNWFIFFYHFWNLYTQYTCLNEWIALILLERKYFVFCFLYFFLHLLESYWPTLVNVPYVFTFSLEYSTYKHFLFVSPHYLFTPGKKVKHISIKDVFSERQKEIFLTLIIDAGPAGQMNKASASCSWGFIGSVSVWALKASSAFWKFSEVFLTLLP